MKYDGSPGTLKARDLDDAGWEELADGVIVAAQPHGAPTWFPCNDRPSNKATYAITMAAPNEYYVAMCGRLTDKRRRGSVTEWTWEMAASDGVRTSRPCRSAATRRASCRTASSWSPRPTCRAKGYDASFGQQPAMMEFFESVFGAYPFDDYTVVVTDDPLEIPLESQALSTFGRNFASSELGRRPTGRPRARPPVVRQRGDPAGVEGHLAARGLRVLRRVALVGGVRATTPPPSAPSTTTTSWPISTRTCCSPTPARHLMFDDRVYKRGALTLHALRTTVGDHDFFDILEQWVERFGGGNATTADFEALATEISGESLDDLFDAWLRSTDLPPLPEG